MTEIILTSSVLILLLALLRRVLRGRIHPGVQYALWLLAAARLLIPGTLFTAPVSMVGAAEELRASIQETYSDPAAHDTSPAGAPSYQPPESGEGPSEDVTALPRFSMWELVSWPELIWKAGVAVTAGALALSNLAFALRLRRNRRRLLLPDTPWTGKLPVYEADGLDSPCLFGLFRPAVYLNAAAMDAEHPEHILAHEYAHYRHGDHLWAVLRSVCLAVHWYNPLVWWAAALSRRDCELACDAAALRRLGERERIDYGQTLLRMVSRKRNPAAFLHTATTMTAGKRAMTERIALIVKGPRMRITTLAAAVLLVCLLAACAFGGGEAKAPEGTEPSPGPEERTPVAVSIGQSASSNSHDYAYITDPAEVARLWELYRSFEYEGSYDPTGMGGWPVSVSFHYGDTSEDSGVFFILSQHGIYTQDGESLRLKNIDAIYDEFLQLSEDPAYSPPLSGPDPAQDPLAENARSIVEQVRQGADVGEWLPLMNYMDWGVLARAAVEAGLDDGDGSAALISIMDAINQYIDRQGPSMTQAEYLYLLSATAGLDGAPSEGYASMIYRMYIMNPSQFAYVVLEMLPETQRNEALDLFCSEWYYHRVSTGTEPPTREEAAAQLEADLEGSVSAAPSEETLYSAGSTFPFRLVNASGIYALTYMSSDPSVAVVDENGVVTAVGPGSAVITMRYEGAGGPLDFTCRVRCEWGDADTPQTAEPEVPQLTNDTAPAEPSFELVNGWQRAFFGFVFEIPAMPDQELVYDNQTENGLEQAVLSALEDYYQSYVAEHGNSAHHDRFSRIILESEIPAFAEYGERITVAYQVECQNEREWNGVIYPVAPQAGDHLTTTFTVMDRTAMMDELLVDGAMGNLPTE